jgi:hypothetical protein
LILKISDIENDIDPIQAMHTHSAMPDDGNDALFAVDNLGGLVLMPIRRALKKILQPMTIHLLHQRKRKDDLTLLHMMQQRKKMIYIHIDLDTGGEAVGII